MLKRPFFGFLKPRFKGLTTDRELQTIEDIPAPPLATIIIEDPDIGPDDIPVSIGQRLKTGQRVVLSTGGDNDYFISTVTGVLSDISDYTDPWGRTLTTLTIKTEEDERDDEFPQAIESSDPDIARKFFKGLPGTSSFLSLLSFDPPINKVIVSAIDKDLLVCTNRFVFDKQYRDLRDGVKILKKIVNTGIVKVVASHDIVHGEQDEGMDITYMEAVYPRTLPNFVIKDLLEEVVPHDKTIEEMGIGYVTAETAVSLSRAFERKEFPVEKIVTVIKEDGSTTLVNTRIGTPVGHILNTLGMEVRTGDRVVMGGPMTGHIAYSLETPVCFDTDALMLQRAEDIIPASNTYCFNCGECVSICPVNLPVNMLVRLLEAGLYEEARDQYDLLCCIECGLCSYVCMARIPVFQYIMLGKYELSKIKD